MLIASSAHELEFQIEFARDGDNPGLDLFHVHIRCFAAWESPAGRPSLRARQAGLAAGPYGIPETRPVVRWTTSRMMPTRNNTQEIWKATAATPTGPAHRRSIRSAW